MNLIDQEQVFQQKTLDINSVINQQVQLPKQVFRENFSEFRIIDFDEIYSKFFFQNINGILKEEKDSQWTFAVLENDPQTFFFKHCKKYPIFEVTTSDTFEDFLSITRDDLDCIPDESLADNAYVIVIYPKSLDWVIYGDHDFELGIVGFQNKEMMKKFISVYGEERVFTMEQAVTELLEVIYTDNTVPEDIRNQLTGNYGTSST